MRIHGMPVAHQLKALSQGHGSIFVIKLQAHGLTVDKRALNYLDVPVSNVGSLLEHYLWTKKSC